MADLLCWRDALQLRAPLRRRCASHRRPIRRVLTRVVPIWRGRSSISEWTRPVHPVWRSLPRRACRPWIRSRGRTISGMVGVLASIGATQIQASAVHAHPRHDAHATRMGGGVRDHGKDRAVAPALDVDEEPPALSAGGRGPARNRGGRLPPEPGLAMQGLLIPEPVLGVAMKGPGSGSLFGAVGFVPRPVTSACTAYRTPPLHSGWRSPSWRSWGSQGQEYVKRPEGDRVVAARQARHHSHGPQDFCLPARGIEKHAKPWGGFATSEGDVSSLSYAGVARRRWVSRKASVRPQASSASRGA